MDFDDAMRDQIAGAGFGDLLDVLADQAQSALLLEPAVSGAGVGRLGGLASLPPGDGWPAWRWRGYESQPMTFVGEFDLAALDEAVWPGPRSGSLSFFAAVEPDALYIVEFPRFGGQGFVRRRSCCLNDDRD